MVILKEDKDGLLKCLIGLSTLFITMNSLTINQIAFWLNIIILKLKISRKQSENSTEDLLTKKCLYFDNILV